MNQLRALRRFNYRGKDRDPGDVFTADSDIHEKLLLQQGSVELVKVEEVLTRSMRAEEPSTIEDKPFPVKRGRYPRRDMRAEK